MKKQNWIALISPTSTLALALALALTLTLALTACNIAPGAGEEHAESVQPLDPSAWPTPQPTPIQASPTPFPKITLAPTDTPTPRPTQAALPSSSVTQENLTFSGDIEALVEQVTDLSGGLPPTAAAMITADNVIVRQGPDGSSPSLGAPQPGELAAILGTNTSGDWYYVLTRSGLQGWLPAGALQVTFSLAEAPILPDDPTSQEPVSSPNMGGPLAGLEAVAVALVTAKDGVPVHQGPAASYPVTGTVAQGELAGIFGTNPAGNWLYVYTISGANGWLPANAVRITGSIEGAAVLSADALAPSPAQSGPSSSPSTSGPTTSASGGQPLDLGKLDPVARARVDNQSLNVRQGPGAAYQKLGDLSRDDEVGVLALNKTGEWALVRTASGGLGWVSLDYLAIDGSLAAAPRIISPAPNRNLPPGQVAPAFSATSGATANATTGNPGQTQSNSNTNPLEVKTDAPPQDAPTSAGINTNRPGRLVFQTSSGGDIMVINPDGSGLRRLTHGIDPALSPDGNLVAFTRWTGEDGALWLIDIDGNNERPVLGGTKQAKHPAWSPDGQRVVVNFQQGGRLDPRQVCQNLIELGDNQPDIPWNVDFDSVEVKLIEYVPHLCWTLPPDPHWGLRVIDAAGGTFEDVPSDSYAFGPDWDPANPWRIVSSGLDGLVQLDVNRSEQWGLSDRGEDHTPVFSPDGRYIAVAFNNNGQYDIHRLNSDGSGRLPLTKTPLWVTAEPGNKKAWNNVSPAWSPDGSQIAFLTDRSAGGRWEIWVMNPDGSNQRPLFPAEINEQLQITYDFVDERVLSWR